MEPDRRVRFQVGGQVQGVGFRYFACMTGQALGVGGWVRNRHDGAVEGEVQGVGSEVARFLTDLRRGPEWGRVDRLDVEEVDALSAPESKFEIRR